MKTISAVVTGIFLLLSGLTNGQDKMESIEPYRLTIAYSKTTNIIFPYAIVSVDRGSKDVLAQKAKGVENILQIKAAKEDFSQTNLTVVTADGKLSSFIVDFAQQPSILNLSLVQEQSNSIVAMATELVNPKEIEQYAKKVFESEKKLWGGRNKKFGVRLKLDGIFIQDNVMYLRMNVANSTHIHYDIEQLRFFIRDQRKVKRTATQELEVEPLLVYNKTDVIKGGTNQYFVLAVPKFTIPDRKYLAIQLMENNGGRHLELRVKNRTIVKAIPVEETEPFCKK